MEENSSTLIIPVFCHYLKLVEVNKNPVYLDYEFDKTLMIDIYGFYKPISLIFNNEA